MRFDYHMHLEYGSYDEAYAEGFVRAAAERGVHEIGFSEHSHTFPEFEQLYYDDLILDDSFVGSFQRKWLKTNKFKYTLDEYFAFIEKLQKKHKVRAGIEVCNFQNQEAVAKILKAYPFDYVIGSVHFLRGWAYDTGAIKAEWDNHPLADIYEWYTQEVEKLAAAGLYDALGHPFNIRLYRHFPDFDVTPYLERVARAMKAADMIVDLNTGTYYHIRTLCAWRGRMSCRSSRPRMHTSRRTVRVTTRRRCSTHAPLALRSRFILRAHAGERASHWCRKAAVRQGMLP